MFYHVISKDNLRDSAGKPMTLEQFKKSVADFYEKYSLPMDHLIELKNIRIENDNAVVEFETVWHVVPKSEAAVIKYEGASKFSLERSVYGGWDITQANLVGWDFL